jgi:hypothetical protein
LIGIIYKNLSIARNVSYALKFSKIKEFLIKNGYNLQSQPENLYKELSFVDKVKALNDTIYIIEILDNKPED